MMKNIALACVLALASAAPSVSQLGQLGQPCLPEAGKESCASNLMPWTTLYANAECFCVLKYADLPRLSNHHECALPVPDDPLGDYYRCKPGSTCKFNKEQNKNKCEWIEDSPPAKP